MLPSINIGVAPVKPQLLLFLLDGGLFQGDAQAQVDGVVGSKYSSLKTLTPHWKLPIGVIGKLPPELLVTAPT